MSQYIRFTENQLNLLIEISDTQDVRLLHLATEPVPEQIEHWSEDKKKDFRLVEVQITGNNFRHKGTKHVYSSPGYQLIYCSHQQLRNQHGLLLKVRQVDPINGLAVVSFLQFFDGVPVVRAWTELKNEGEQDIGIEYVSSFALSGICQARDWPNDFTRNQQLYIPHNTWTAETQWKQRSLQEWGLDFRVDGEQKQASTKRVFVNNNTSWSCSEFSPNGILENPGTGVTAIWQIENNGAWHWEVTDIGVGDLLALRLSGPCELDNSWWINLKPGKTFTSVKAAFTQINGNYEQAIQAMNSYRRKIRRENRDNQQLPVIFNDYMNGLMGDPTTEKLLPLVDAAAAVGCEYFVIDCGWYADGYWWDSVGEWLPSKQRFPKGIEEVVDYIRAKHMVPGLWLEIEVMGINCPLAKQLPDDWFFMRHGKRIIDSCRYHLDFRNPKVREFATKVMDRVLADYGVGYIKMDYNITTGIGTDVASDSMGDGLLGHQRAYLEWLDGIFVRYPDLIIENCGSGGMRHDYVMLQRHSIQSLTDQMDYVKNGAIAAAGASVMTPEQCAIWAYPLTEGDDEEVIYNMVNGMLLRIHQSGHLAKINQHRLALVKEAIEVYKEYRDDIKIAQPIWPAGLPNLYQEWVSFGLETKEAIYLGVWHGYGNQLTYQLDLSRYGNLRQVSQLYPVADSKVKCELVDHCLNIQVPGEKMARLYKIQK